MRSRADAEMTLEGPCGLRGSCDAPAACPAADVETIAWHPEQPTVFLVSSEDGMVCAFDARLGAGSKPMYRLQAHDKATTALRRDFQHRACASGTHAVIGASIDPSRLHPHPLLSK